MVYRIHYSDTKNIDMIDKQNGDDVSEVNKH